MMKMSKYKIPIIFFITVFISVLFIAPVFAQMKDIRQLEESEPGSNVASQVAITRPKVEYNADNFKDPFSGGAQLTGAPTEVSAEQVSLPELTVQGVVWGGKFPEAIMNNKVVKTGDTIEGVRVISIDKDGVTVFFEGKQVKVPSPAAGAPVPKKP